MESRRILVLGGNGFIGSHLVEALLAQGCKVRVLTRQRSPNSVQLPEVDYRYADFANPMGVAESLVDVDTVVHLISTTVPVTANMDPLADIQDNLLSTVKLLQQMRDIGVPRLIFISSGGTVYGDTATVPIPEEHERNPLSSYGIVKVAIENYILMFSRQFGLKSLILRVSNPFGPRQGHLGVQGVIPTFFQRIIAKEQIRIWGDGSAIRDYIYISDLIAFMVGSIRENLEGIYNVGSGRGVSLSEILTTIQDVSGVKANVEYLPARDFDVKKVILDISKATNALDWLPRVSLKEGCKLYWKWAHN